ncbi:MAG TPA: asparagine synthase (glutamine-hydrolyzing) [Ignavibacteriaceae bacterium]|nr:asparagine synthase (glutamine-hydrolyzing) [Ignavibacteriaceae bacterium]
MCGIAAILAFDDKTVLNKCTLENMTKEINHRGPDDEGFYLNDWVGFGFKRLSIIDTSYDGHQPMSDTTANYVIVFNGEIYNYRLLKEELIKKNYKFKSNTDTEVLLNAYVEWGSSCLLKLEGMFSFIIYDKINEEVIAARDHLGIKPLYYFSKNKSYFFASEIKAFRNLIKFELNDKQLYEQFLYAYVSGQNTIFKNIFRLKPGTFMKFNKQGFVCENQYYNINNALMNKPSSSLNLEEIKNDINESIFKHTMSDVGYNIQLSGGVDSSYITAVLSKEYRQTLNTYSIKLENSISDESKYQNIVSEKYNTVHHSYTLGGKDLRESCIKATWHYDIPLVHPPSALLMLLCSHSRSNSKVILTGEGSDELFGGYNSFKTLKLYKYNIPYFFQHYGLIDIIPNIPALNNIKNSLHSFSVGIDQSSYFPYQKFKSLFNGLNKDIAYRESVVNNFDQLADKVFASFQTSYLNFLLERQDKMSMAMSVEARVPFSNHLLFDKLNKISFKKKIKPVPKAILKKLAEQYFDKSFIYRKKNGFNVPIGSWLRDENGLKPLFDFLTDKTFRERGFYNHKNIYSLVDKHLSRNENNSIYLTNIINFEIWHRIFIDAK